MELDLEQGELPAAPSSHVKKQLEAAAIKMKQKRALSEGIAFLLVSFILLAALIEMSVRWIVTPLVEESASVSWEASPASAYQSRIQQCYSSKHEVMGFGMTDSSPVASLCQREFMEYLCLIIWMVIVVSGLGTEVLVGTFALRNMDPESGETFWMIAQFLFSLCAVVALLGASQQSPFCLIFLVMGLWKFGFPETLGYATKARKAYRENGLLSVAFMGHASNCWGTLMHHSSAALLIAVLLTGLTPLTRAITSSIIPLILQHVFVVLRYVDTGLYTVILLMLDVYFQETLKSSA